MVFNAARHCRIGYNDAAQAENFLMLCVFAAWFLLREGAPSAQLPHEHGGSPPPGIRKSQTPLFSYCFVAGLVLGAAVWLKYNAIVFFPFVLLIPFVDFHAWDRGSSRVRMSISWKDWLVRASFVGAGFVLIVVAVLGHFWVSGAWPAMMKAHFEVLPRYGATGFQFSISYLIRDLRMSQNNLGLWTEVMALLSLVIAWWRRELAALAPIFLMALAGYLCVAIQGRFHFYHFETCHPLFAMFWGYVCVMTWKAFSYVRKLFAKRRWAVAGAMSWVVLASLVFAAVNEDLLRVVQQYEFFADWMKNPELSYKAYYPQLPLEKLYDQLSMIDFLKRDSDQNDEVYVWGMAPLVNFIAKRHSPTRFFYNYPLMSTWGLESWRQELVQTLETKSPRYIIVERNDENPVFTNIEMTSEQYLRLRQFTSLSNLLARRYKPAAHYTDFEVYTLNEKLKPDRTISTPK
jgi:hypothetical protein